MYQVPVGNIEKIRKARKAVKNILSEIGLEDCQSLLKDLNENAEKNTEKDEAFDETNWAHVTYGYNSRLQKKWPYRSRSLCCNMCKYSSQNIYNFRSHVSRCHAYVQSFCALASCTRCLFIGHPKVVKRHMLLFHAKMAIQSQPPKDMPLSSHRGNERYHCRRCGFPSSSIFSMKKHIILKHLDNLAEQYIGYRLATQGTSSVKVYCCKVCRVNTGNLDQMLHHMLVEPSHYSVSTQVQGLIYENKNFTIKSTPNGNGLFVTFPSIAPKPQQPQVFTSKSMILSSNSQPVGTMVALQQVQRTTNSTTLFCAPGTNQAFLPPQASALVQLASAEAKGLLKPGATIALRSALPQGPSMVQLPVVSTQQRKVSLNQAPMALVPASVQPQQTPRAKQILLPSGARANVAAAPGTVAKPAMITQKAPMNQMTQQGTMLTSQSLLSHLIPTGNMVNGLPTYTFAPLQVAMPVSQSTSTPNKAAELTSSPSPQAKKWITCPLCNELFPSTLFDMHTEVAHQAKSNSKSESVAARAAFLKKMPDKTVKCLMCKILLSEKSVFQHLLHGLNCLYCSALFFSIKQLAEHVKQHNPASKAYCDFLRQKYRVYSKGAGGILFPYFDVRTTAPKEVLGETEVNLALVTNSFDLIFFKLQPSSQPEICPAPVKINTSYCPFCSEKFQNEAKHLEHLKQKHFVAPTIHAILKTEAFKCIYCNGVYTGKVTQQAVMLHIQRCRCSPKQPLPLLPPRSATAPPQQPPKPAQQPPTPAQQLPKPAQQLPKPAQQLPKPAQQLPKPAQQLPNPAQQLPKPAQQLPKPAQQLPKPAQQLPKPAQQLPKPAQQLSQPPGLYFLQVPQGLTMKQVIAPARVIPAAPPAKPAETEAEQQSKKRLEAALKEVIEANKREREQKAAVRKKREQEKLLPPPAPVLPINPTVKLLLEPTPSERRSNEERRDFISKYFNLNPYASKVETEELCRRLSLTKAELASHFGIKRSKCMKSLKRSTAAVLLGFSMTEVRKVKHSLVIPEQEAADAKEQSPADSTEVMENGEDGPEPMDESGKERVADRDRVEQMECVSMEQSENGK